MGISKAGRLRPSLQASNLRKNIRKLLGGGEEWRMIRVYGERLSACRVLLHLLLHAEG